MSNRWRGRVIGMCNDRFLNEESIEHSIYIPWILKYHTRTLYNAENTINQYSGAR